MVDLNYELLITYGGGTFTFPIMPEFFPKMEFKWKRSGHEVAVVDRVPVHGWFAESDQDGNISKWNTLKAIAQNGAFVSMVARKTDTTQVYAYSTAQIQNLEMVSQPGGYVNHVEFTFDITEERGVTFPSLVDVGLEEEEIEEIDEKGAVRTKTIRTVRAVGKNGSVSAARSFVLGLKPQKIRMRRSSLRSVTYDGEVVGIWEHETTPEKKGRKARRWVEKAYYSPGQRTERFYPAAEGITPILIEGGFTESTVTVSGEVELYADSDLDVSDVVSRIKAQMPAATKVVLRNPSFGNLIPIEFDVVDPTLATVYATDYSYTLAFGEATEPGVHIPIDTMSDITIP